MTRRLTGWPAAAALAAAFAITMLGTTLPTPLYPLYAAKFGFGELLSTVIFAVYAVGVTVGLLLFGAQLVIAGLVSELIVDRDPDELEPYSVSERTALLPPPG